MKIVEVTPNNAEEHSFFCIKNIKEPGFEFKRNWFAERAKEGLKLKLIYADDGKQIGFIEYVPAEYAWRPVDADGWLFIHCIMVYPNKYRSSGAAAAMIQEATNEAKKSRKAGVCTMTSNGPWIANKKVFEKAGFQKVDKRGRFELMAVKFDENSPDPKLIIWDSQLPKYKGWHLLYADQCPWHDKGVKALIQTAQGKGIDLKVKKIVKAEVAKQMPSGFGVFALIHDGKLLEDHYISKTRFETIIKKETN
jgi:hypothetical protein